MLKWKLCFEIFISCICQILEIKSFLSSRADIKTSFYLYNVFNFNIIWKSELIQIYSPEEKNRSWVFFTYKTYCIKIIWNTTNFLFSGIAFLQNFRNRRLKSMIFTFEYHLSLISFTNDLENMIICFSLKQLQYQSYSHYGKHYEVSSKN